MRSQRARDDRPERYFSLPRYLLSSLLQSPRSYLEYLRERKGYLDLSTDGISAAWFMSSNHPGSLTCPGPRRAMSLWQRSQTHERLRQTIMEHVYISSHYSLRINRRRQVVTHLQDVRIHLRTLPTLTLRVMFIQPLRFRVRPTNTLGFRDPSYEGKGERGRDSILS